MITSIKEAVLTEPLYFESHITIAPVFDERLERLQVACHQYGFRVADLFMKKRLDEAPERSRFDTFCTGHGQDMTELSERMLGLVGTLRARKYKIWRYKIEAVLLDKKEVRYPDQGEVNG